MHAVWLCSLERELMLAKDEVVRPHTSCMETRPRDGMGGGVKASASARQLYDRIQPLETQRSKAEDDVLKRKKKEASHACWLAWCEQKNEKLREERQRDAAASAKKDAAQQYKKRQNASTQAVDASFMEWKRTKWRKKREEEEAYLAQREHERALLEKYTAAKNAAVRERQEALARLQARKPKKKPPRHVVVPPPVAFHKMVPIEYVSTAFQHEIERKLQHQLDVQEAEAARGTFRDAITAKEIHHYKMQMHSKNAHRADSLQQLRHWAKPTPEIYTLASLLYKLVALETPTTTQLVDVWRWLPWQILQRVFQDDLVQKLQAIQIADLAPETLALLYLHCAQPHFSVRAIEDRSAVGTALRLWVNNVAAVHDLVDPATHDVKGIDRLKSCGVSCRAIGALVLLLQVYPRVNLKLKERSQYTDKQLKQRQEDIALLRELYATQPTPTDNIAPLNLQSIQVDQVEASDLIGLLDLPAFTTQVPKTRSKLAARLAARLQDTQAFEEDGGTPRAATPASRKALHDDFVVVYELSIPSKEVASDLTPVNYISQKRRESSLKQGAPWIKTRRPSRVDIFPKRDSKKASLTADDAAASKQHAKRNSRDTASSTPSTNVPEAAPPPPIGDNQMKETLGTMHEEDGTILESRPPSPMSPEPDQPLAEATDAAAAVDSPPTTSTPPPPSPTTSTPPPPSPSTPTPPPSPSTPTPPPSPSTPTPPPSPSTPTPPPSSVDATPPIDSDPPHSTDNVTTADGSDDESGNDPSAAMPPETIEDDQDGDFATMSSGDDEEVDADMDAYMGGTSSAPADGANYDDDDFDA
ncbi:Aste57867_20424 [Aphanomyces stellatus]|uniref:Aste57867_20424 protein n=1 Tax=Aphanomyces stellatus TaxID=120398 RepID=A0A485LFJ1_9STRA|nr:hypothetical protein As57867_020358 [Aphanomyces stellatus]VFT97110.1 Aste57867_20424 [Aphanomyces stellatus]